MPVNNSYFVPPVGKVHTIINAIGDVLSPIVEEVRYTLRQPEEERRDKVVYIEPGVMSVNNDSLEGTMRSFATMQVAIHGYINDKDARVGADFIEEIINALMDETSFFTFRDSYGVTGQGFSIGSFENITPGFADNYFIFTILANIESHEE